VDWFVGWFVGWWIGLWVGGFIFFYDFHINPPKGWNVWLNLS